MRLLVGTDIESIERFKKLIDFKFELLKKMFFEDEISYALGKANSCQSLAGIWCAKEAVVKSFNQVAYLDIRDVKVISRKNSSPKVSIEKLKLKEINFDISISISHSKHYATAVAILTIFD